MINQADLTHQLAIDAQGLGKLQRSARENSPEAIKAAASQFEALFLNMMLKSMRDASGGEGGIFDSEQSRMYVSMLDQQFSQSMASRGVGLADMLIRQLSPSAPVKDTKGHAGLAPLSGLGSKPPASPSSAMPDAIAGSSLHADAASDQPPHVQQFLARMEKHAEEASRTTGIPSKFILAQAALESGWGKHEIVGAGGERSHNVFGIKAGANWKGRVVETLTTEYVDGVAHRRVEQFRAYESYADAFRDYAKLLSNNPRYQYVIAQGRDAVGFASGLQRAGYATDPDYAAKLARIIRNHLV